MEQQTKSTDDDVAVAERHDRVEEVSHLRS